MPQDAFELKIVYPTSSKTVPILWVEVQAPNGNFIVGPNHTPIVSLIKERSVLTYQEYQGKKISLDAYQGIFKFYENKALILFG